MKTRELIAWVLLVTSAWLGGVGWLRFYNERAAWNRQLAGARVNLDFLWEKAAHSMNNEMEKAHDRAVFEEAVRRNTTRWDGREKAPAGK